MLSDPVRLLAALRAAHEAVRDEAVRVCEQQAAEQLAAVAAYEGGDVIYALDRVCEPILLERFEVLAGDWSCVLVAEGLGPNGMVVFPRGCSADQAELRVLVDPIDGTRGLMYGKRPAWILTGVAPNQASPPRWLTSSWPSRPRSRCPSSTCATRCGRSPARAPLVSAPT